MKAGSPRYRFSVRLLAPGLLACGLLPGVAASAFEPGDEVRATADRVNMRARPGLNYEVVHQVNFGDTLTVAERDGDEWVGVQPPAGTFAWIHRDYVEDGRVSVARLNARSGPGINYSVLGRLGRGTEVVPEETFGEWIKIAAPRDGRLWVHRNYLEPVTPEIPETVAGAGQGWVTMPATEPAPGTRTASLVPPQTGEPLTGVAEAAQDSDGLVGENGTALQVASATRATPPEASTSAAGDAEAADGDTASADQSSMPYPPPEDMDLVPLEGQGGAGAYEGSLSRVKYLIGRPTRFELVAQEDGRRTTVCYVHGNRQQLDGFVGRHMRITGRTYWIQDLKRPVVVPERIHLDPPAAVP